MCEGAWRGQHADSAPSEWGRVVIGDILAVGGRSVTELLIGVAEKNGGAFRFAAVAVAGGRGPLEDAGSASGEVEIAVSLDLVVAAAEGCEIADGGASAAAGVGVVPLRRVVELAFVGAVGATGTDAGAVAGEDVINHGLGGPIAGVPHVQYSAGEGVGDDPIPVPAGGEGSCQGGADRTVAVQEGDLVGV